ncbi:hypothetical protein EPO56_04000 [Patescibacteria group bacterium]|nr:MAG: hypothetical protein EPO56_04000 [Patescibacteria group bacterium]
MESDKQSLEILFHLAKRNTFWLSKHRDLDYPGIDRKYFDSRVIEYKSLMGADFSIWSDIEIKGWEDLA